jgi:uncharacterized protein (DUF427 family)
MRMSDAMDRLRDELRYEPTGKRVRAEVGGHLVVDTTRAVLVWEPRRICPTYAVPEEDLWAELSPAKGTAPTRDGILHPGIPFAVHSAAGEPVTIRDRVGAGYRLDDIPGYVVLDFDAFDAWHEEDERIFGHPRDPFSSVEVRRASRPVRIELNGVVLAETTRAQLLYENFLTTRFYVPREDVLVALEPHPQRTYCPYKGEASYWSAEAGGRRYDAIAWTYHEPLPDRPAIAGLVCFWNEIVDIYVDGELREPPTGPVADAMRSEFGLAV